jgi:F-type H+-transporting ATPase subunit alpha
MPLAQMIVVLMAASSGYLDEVNPDDVAAFERYILDRFESEHPGVYDEINRTGELTDEIRDTLIEALTGYRADWDQRSQAR